MRPEQQRAPSGDVHVGVQIERWPNDNLEGVRAYAAHDGLVCLQMWTPSDTTSAFLTADKVDQLIEALKRAKEIAAPRPKRAL